jgi:hypothetical protein
VNTLHKGDDDDDDDDDHDHDDNNNNNSLSPVIYNACGCLPISTGFPCRVKPIGNAYVKGIN